MVLRRLLLLLAILAGFLYAPLGCTLFESSRGTNTSGGGGAMGPPNFSNTVVVGDSLSAGFQNDSLLDSQQPNGWASLVAQQASFKLVLPLIAPPGTPAVLELVSVGPPPVIKQVSGISIGRDNPGDQPTDLAVPGQSLNEIINDAPTALPTSDEDIITDLVLGFPIGNDKSQMNETIQLNPTALFVWAGNDDAVQADESGSPASMTAVSVFTQEFQQLLSTLHSTTKATLIVANIPDVTQAPYLTPAATILAEVAQETGLSQAQAATGLGIQDGDLINATGLAQMQSAVTAIKQGQSPTALTDAGFLDPAEIAQVQNTVDQYNAAIAQEVSAAGGILVDLHAYIQSLQQNGITINSYHATTAFLGGLFSLDGLHPTNTGYALIANQFIDAMNISLKTSIADVNVSAIAATDPLFGPNIKPSGAVSIPLNAARLTDRVIAPGKAASPAGPPAQ